MILGVNQLPGMPAGDVIMIKRDAPAETTEGGLVIPKTAQSLECFGTIMHAGLSARDKMYDNGHDVGDYVSFGKFASVLGEWDRLTAEGDPDCKHDWERASYENEWRRSFGCSKCKAMRCQEAIAIMQVEDIKVNYTMEERLRSGAMRIVRRNTSVGTQHQIERAPYFDEVPTTSTSTHFELSTKKHEGVTNGRS